MGWIRGRAATNIATRTPELPVEQRTKTKENAEHVEDVSNIPEELGSLEQRNEPKLAIKYPHQSLAVADEDLPFISTEQVLSKRRPGILSGRTINAKDKKDYWIVVDDIVYDCTDFIEEHPGGEQVILSFVGEDCSWQFWRFHGKSEMEQYGKGLRIGRTTGIINRFKEPVRFVGLCKFGNDDW